jgi:hypothetical protein
MDELLPENPSGIDEILRAIEEDLSFESVPEENLHDETSQFPRKFFRRDSPFGTIYLTVQEIPS